MLMADVVAPIQSLEQLQLFLSEDEDRRMLSGRTQMEVFLRRGVVMVLMRRSLGPT